MHWRKPFPPRSVRPSPLAELRSLIVSSLAGEPEKCEKPAPAEKLDPAAEAASR